jgi:cellulose synthase/poly-beta-1,6-N-acetylglucosamine synthase-like glycosyltransferase
MIAYYFLLGITWVYIAIQLWQLITLFKYKHHYLPEPESWPEISILIAARNEEANIRHCLDSLLNLDYPKEKLHIVCGNDQSTDQSGFILHEYASKHSHIKVVDIIEDDLGLKAKARVMSQLEKHANGTFYLITDADIMVKPTWAKFMIRSMKPDMGVCSGTTLVKGENTGSMMQEIDWAYFMGMLNIISYNGVPATAVGNNMIVRAKAYHETGGYSAIQFSITEDYKLYSEICKKGWRWNNVMQPEVTAYSAPISGFFNLLHQRKRWLTGGKELPWYWWILFGIFGLFYFLLPVILFINPMMGFCIWTIKWLLQTLQIISIYKYLDEHRPSVLQLLMYEGFLSVHTICTAVFSLLPFKTNWKNRLY